MVRQRSPLPIPEMTCPLGDEHCALLDRALKSCADTSCVLDKLEAMGMDVSQFRNEVDANQRVAAGLKAIYFPDRS